MATFFDSLTDKHIEFIRRQHMFCVATAAAQGRVNVSPKGMDTFRVLDANTVAYLDMGGSGNETSAHIQNDGRITFMFCSYDATPLILRLYGQGEVVRQGSSEWAALAPAFEQIHGQRQIIRARIVSVQDSCGYAVPRYEFAGERDTLRKYYANLSQDEILAKQAKQTKSIDGLPLVPAYVSKG